MHIVKFESIATKKQEGRKSDKKNMLRFCRACSFTPKSNTFAQRKFQNEIKSYFLNRLTGKIKLSTITIDS